MFQLLLDGFVLGIWAGLFAGALTQPGEVFAWVPRLYRWVVRAEQGEPLQGWRYALSKPLYDCAVCHAGQLSLWGFLLLYERPWQPWEHFTFIVAAMFAAHEMNRKIWA